MQTQKKSRGDIITADAFEVEELRSAVFGKDTRISPILALTLLGRKEYPEKLGDMERVLRDADQGERVRHTAAIELSRIGSEEAVRVLMDNIDAKQDFVARGVIKALGGLAGPGELRVIAERIKRPGVSQTATWAATFAAFRLGTEGFEMRLPRQEDFIELDQRRAEVRKVEPIDAETATRILRDLHEDVQGIELVAKGAAAIMCADRTFVFLANKVLLNPDIVLRQKAVAGVAAVQSPREPNPWTIRHYIFSQPSGDARSLQVFVTTTGGILALADEGKVERQRAAFTLRSVNRPGAIPAEMRCVYEEGEVRFAEVRSEPRKLKGRAPDRERT